MVVDLAQYDEEQARLMEEMCIVIDENDNRVGADSKKTCHLMENINQGLLHRAFSVFLFDSENRLLLQQRAPEKITFPNMWTNTCCSHPLNTPSELVEENQLGARTAAQRKLEHELGIPPEQVPLDNFEYLTRIHYVAPSDGTWGEHEIDYIFFIKSNVTLNVNPNEVSNTKYVTQQELRAMMDDSDVPMTPWFKLICDSFLFKWWEKIDSLETQKDETTIHRLGF
ncbi:isopentenyl-diphosphate delta-isomerase [Lichtheimia ornata]|uniref:isopentenyl-diphosphate Delta-isomerase n=1 Tax=Lichtheimia ornata TaxID=688661 RepID=A0AAD7Y4E4_9FUNG|nr:isopentenyl-diphosphate delta-isomerase [Lichtheimia ornata]KAJ8663609.1 isopentenyl-diphosphate delta-isomerase [Lichtheimia ornata]